MSQETLLKTLVELGFDLSDAQVYVFLAKRGQQKALDICKALKINKQQLYPCLKKLESRGIVTSTLEHPAKFWALPFDKVLDLFIKAKMEEAQSIRQSKREILANWQSLQLGETSDTGRFTIIEGRKYIYARIQQMIQETHSKISCISSVAGLIRADQFGLFRIIPQQMKPKIHFRFLTELTEQNTEAMSRLLKEMETSKIPFEGKTPEIGLPLFPRIIIRDDQEAMFFIEPHNETAATEADDVCLWTNCNSLVYAFRGIFDELWRKATDIEKKIYEAKTCKPAKQTQIINDPSAAKKIYDNKLNAAICEILIMTSSKHLKTLSENIALLELWAQKGVSVKIMAPITSENFDAVQHINRFCEVRHVPASLLNTTVVDGRYLFQFRNSPQEPEASSDLFFENTFYTDEAGFVEKAKSTLNDVWNNSAAPSTNTLQAILKPLLSTPKSNQENVLELPPQNAMSYKASRPMHEVSAFEISEEKTLTEQDILTKIIHGEKYKVKNPLKDLTRTYGNDGQAVIHPPKFLNLPDFMIHAFHNDKQSSYGNEDYIVVYLWLPTPRGNMFVPVSVVGDVIKGEEGLRKVWAGTPAGENVKIVRKDQLQVQLHGNNFFAGWTAPIPLYPSTYVLPASAILLEAFGKLVTGRFTVALPSGCKVVAEMNGYSAFVTFFHPESKYSGPGTDGIVNRDLIMTTYPPQTRKAPNQRP